MSDRGDQEVLRWWVSLTMKVAASGRREVGRDEICEAGASLRQAGVGEGVPGGAMALGERFGFVRDRGESQRYVLPIAGCLSHLSPGMARQAGAVLGGLWETVGGGVAEPVGMGGEEAAGGGWAVIDFLSRRDREMLLLRFGVADGRPRTLGELGEGFRLTRERVRQIQEKALRRLRHPVRAKLLVSDFSRGLMARRGSLVVGSAQSGTPFVRFTSRCLRIPYVELHDLGVVVLGVGPEAVPGGGSGADWRTLASEDAVAAAVEARYGPYLSASDLAILVKAAMGVGK